VLFGADLLIGNEVAISPSALDGHSRQRSSPEVTERSAATMLLGLEIPPRISNSVRNAPGLFCQGCARSVPALGTPLPLCFS
jgi:hypothetical protein